MAENNSSAPLKTAEGTATLWCVHVTGADDVHPMPSREVALEEANALNTSICRIKRQDIDPVLIAVVAEWPHSADSHAAGLMIRDECLRMRGDQAVAAQAAPAAVAAPEWDKVRRGLTMLMLGFAGRTDCTESAAEAVLDAATEPGMPLEALRAALAATPALPATEDSSAGDLAEVVHASTYVQPVPDHCDRVVWRGQYIHLPIAQAEVQAEPVDWDELPEDANERAMFDRNLDLYGGDPRVAIATALRLWANTRGNGSFGLMCAIYANEVAKMHIAAPQAQPADALDADQPEPADLWYLQDTRGYVGNDVLWWAKDGNGYTTDISKAHAYTRDEAFQQAAMRGTDRAWPKAYIDSKTRPAVDMQYIDHQAAMAAAQEGGKA